MRAFPVEEEAPARITIVGAPMDLGSARRGVDMGPSALRFARVADRLRALGHEVTDIGDVRVAHRDTMPEVAANAMSAIVDTCTELAVRTRHIVLDGAIPLVLGGDHSIAAGSVAGVANAYREQRKRIGLIWLDAHADLNTPATSITGNVHGMPVAHLLGHGHGPLSTISSRRPAVRPENAVLVGIRELDPAERAHIRDWGITTFTMREVDERGLRNVLEDAVRIACEGTAGFHLSVDADWVDPADAPGVGTPVRGGATFREAHLAMEIAHDSGKLLGIDFVEVNPILDIHNLTGELGADLIASAFGLRVLERKSERTRRAAKMRDPARRKGR